MGTAPNTNNQIAWTRVYHLQQVYFRAQISFVIFSPASAVCFSSTQSERPTRSHCLLAHRCSVSKAFAKRPGGAYLDNSTLLYGSVRARNKVPNAPHSQYSPN